MLVMSHKSAVIGQSNSLVCERGGDWTWLIRIPLLPLVTLLIVVKLPTRISARADTRQRILFLLDQCTFTAGFYVYIYLLFVSVVVKTVEYGIKNT